MVLQLQSHDWLCNWWQHKQSCAVSAFCLGAGQILTNMLCLTNHKQSNQFHTQSKESRTHKQGAQPKNCASLRVAGNASMVVVGMCMNLGNFQVATHLAPLCQGFYKKQTNKQKTLSKWKQVRQAGVGDFLDHGTFGLVHLGGELLWSMCGARWRWTLKEIPH